MCLYSARRYYNTLVTFLDLIYSYAPFINRKYYHICISKFRGISIHLFQKPSFEARDVINKQPPFLALDLESYPMSLFVFVRNVSQI